MITASGARYIQKSVGELVKYVDEEIREAAIAGNISVVVYNDKGPSAQREAVKILKQRGFKVTAGNNDRIYIDWSKE